MKHHQHNIIFLLLILLSSSFLNAKQLYKWVDANGHIQYSDREPVTLPKAGVAKMNTQGIITQQAESIEEKEARIKQEKLDQLNDKKKLAEKQHDKALLDTYSSIDKIIAERDRKISLLNNSVKVLLTSKKDLLDKVIALQKKSKFFIAQKRPISNFINNKIKDNNNQIDDITQQIKIRQQDIERFRTQANEDISRFKVLTQQN